MRRGAFGGGLGKLSVGWGRRLLQRSRQDAGGTRGDGKGDGSGALGLWLANGCIIGANESWMP
jgi:hypothetical protein